VSDNKQIVIFVYGSNMLRVKLQKDAPSAERIDIGQLKSHVLTWTKRSKDGSGKCDAAYTGKDTDVTWGFFSK
jgi:gamma-glutamylcyclotransferase